MSQNYSFGKIEDTNDSTLHGASTLIPLHAPSVSSAPNTDSKIQDRIAKALLKT